MKTSEYTTMFRCLCLDLEVECIRIPTVAERGQLRNSLLTVFECAHYTAVQLARRDALYQSWLGSMRQFFVCRTTGCFSREELPFIRRMYQLLSFEQRKPVELTEQQNRDYITKFLQTEQETKAWRVDPNDWVSRCARVICRYALCRCDLSAQRIAELGRHGPGAVLDRSVGVDKNLFAPPAGDLALSYPYDTFFYDCGKWADWVHESSARFVASPDSDVSSPPMGTHSRHVECRLALVPKDYRGPRGVFTSSKEAMFCQLGQAEALVAAVRSSWLSVCYDPADQQPSRDAALSGVIGYGSEAATLDLSDASDRIPLSLVAWLFSRELYVPLARTRPSYVWLPGPSGSDDQMYKHKLGMFAPMGDGKTFQVLSIICCVIATAAIMVADGWSPGRKLQRWRILSAARRLRVFGDDIIVDVRYAELVVKALEAHNLRVNVRKSFLKGVFREACGVDALYGEDITPVRNSRFLNLDKLTNEDVHRITALHRNVSAKFGERSATALSIEGLAIRRFGILPYTNRKDGVGLYSSEPWVRYARAGAMIRFNCDHQVFEACVRWPRAESYPLESDSWWDLNYTLLPKGGQERVSIPYETPSLIKREGSLLTELALRSLLHNSRSFRKLAKSLGLRPCRGVVHLEKRWFPIEGPTPSGTTRKG